ncbi:hypothetical protein LXL04_002932 [Taraxacum kok-saghyz]
MSPEGIFRPSIGRIEMKKQALDSFNEVIQEEGRHRNSSFGFSIEFIQVLASANEFMREMVKFLDAKSFEAREMAPEMLLRLVVVPRNQKRFMQNDQSVNFLLQLIDGGDENSVRGHDEAVGVPLRFRPPPVTAGLSKLKARDVKTEIAD